MIYQRLRRLSAAVASAKPLVTDGQIDAAMRALGHYRLHILTLTGGPPYLREAVAAAIRDAAARADADEAALRRRTRLKRAAAAFVVLSVFQGALWAAGAPPRDLATMVGFGFSIIIVQATDLLMLKRARR